MGAPTATPNPGCENEKKKPASAAPGRAELSATSSALASSSLRIVRTSAERLNTAPGRWLRVRGPHGARHVHPVRIRPNFTLRSPAGNTRRVEKEHVARDGIRRERQL